MGWNTSLAPHIPLRIPPSHFYFAFQGQRSCYSCLYQASLDLLRADKVCLARSLDTDTLASAKDSLSAHLLPALPAQKVVVVPDHQPALPGTAWPLLQASKCLAWLRGTGRTLPTACLVLLRCLTGSGCPWGCGFWHPYGRELLLCLPMTLLGGGRPERGLGVERTRLRFLPSASANKRHYSCVTVKSPWNPALVHSRAPHRAPGLPAQHPARPVQRIPGSTDQHRVSGVWQSPPCQHQA